MQSVIHQALNAYAQAAVDADVMTAHPHRLILMLFEAARVAIARARRHLASGETAAKGEAISKAIQIIDHGLKASLDVKAGGELAERLSALYEYMSRRLLVANQRNDGDALAEVARLLAELQEAWEAIAPGGGNSAPETSAQTLSVTG
ncbi:flagellar export chaperone FliS [Pelomicrobium methylotrophicum]|uniref:Flagellar secretion chaperone FliS n=1 Tax=Pelomicrobium methylotrophicum TaxID=2602750 RepID=A0A5C7EXK4_9PROT|nr:flagellar export chaperone FliS [Pelomicrobium methylotrophicum]TXF11799.1 flagellar export chaperone FliS [Pelomicrobium methylotrophicum]